MKITIIGAGGVRTPLMLKSFLAQQTRLNLTELALMDVDSTHLKLIQALSTPLLEKGNAAFRTLWTTDAREAIQDADYVMTTFRAGGIASRIVDEQVPLRYGVLGQETTGPGGFAMALRTISPILEYVKLVRLLAPGAWIINFTNPAGIITEAIRNQAGFMRAIGICDNPPAMHRDIAHLLGAQLNEVFPEYFGLNHLGWVKAIHYHGQDVLPDLMVKLGQLGQEMHGLPFDPAFIKALGMVPNEYLYFYYCNREAVDHIRNAGQSRARQIAPFNQWLFEQLNRIQQAGGSVAEMNAAYAQYLHERQVTYMSIETGTRPSDADSEEEMELAEGYAGVALRVIDCLHGGNTGTLVLNVPNQGAIAGMEDQDIVEVSCYLAHGVVRPIAMGCIPDHALGLMKQVKAYEKLTVKAAVTGSYATALMALALHPLVPGYNVAKRILDDYIEQHGDLFPSLI